MISPAALVACLLLSGPAGELVTVDRAATTTRLVALDAESATFQSDDKRTEIDCERIVAWGRPVERLDRPAVVLADGLLVGDVVRIGQRVSLRSAALGTIELPRADVRGLVVQPPSGPARWDTLLDQCAAGRLDDWLLLVNGDRLSGRLLALDGQEVRWAQDGQRTIPRASVAAIGLAGAGEGGAKVPPAAQAAWIGLADGSRLPVDGARIDGDKLVLLIAGQTWPARAEQLVWFCPRSPRVVWLSDLAAAEYRHLPYLSLERPFGRDRTSFGGRLRAGGVLYPKGLGMYSTGRLTYALGKAYTRFETHVALDDRGSAAGSVRFRVFVDGRERLATGDVRRGDAPQPVAIDVASAERLDLVVDFGERADVGDAADWLAARLLR